MKTKLLLLTLLLSMMTKAQDGVPDAFFGANGIMEQSVFAEFVDMKLDYYNKVVALGKGLNGLPVLVRFNSDGTLDTAFDEDGIKEIDFGNGEETPASFCIFDNAGPEFYGYLVTSSLSGKLARVLNDGSLASTFGTDGIYTYSTQATTLSFVNYDWANYKIVVCQSNGGMVSSTGGNIYRIDPAGSPDITFNGGNPVNFQFDSGSVIIPNALHTDDDGSIYVSGTHRSGGMYATYIAKFLTTGERESSHELTSGDASLSVPKYFFNPIDKTSYALGTKQNTSVLLTKKTETGSPFADFGTDGDAVLGFGNTYVFPQSLSLGYNQDDEVSKIIIAGRTSMTLTDMGKIVVFRLNNDGSLDVSFGTNGYTRVSTNLQEYNRAVASAIDYQTGKLYVMGKIGTNGKNDQQATMAPVSLIRLNLGSVLSVSQAQNKKVTIHPNPVREQLHFSDKLKSVTIYDIAGRAIKIENSALQYVDVSGLSKGNYILKGESETGIRVVEKFMKY